VLVGGVEQVGAGLCCCCCALFEALFVNHSCSQAPSLRECFQGTVRSSRLGVVPCTALSLRLWWCPHSCLVSIAAF
jgi:hypothetical protein